MIHIDVEGRRMPSYLARPEGGAKTPGVVVLQEVFGVNAEMRRISDLLASAGFTAIAPNFYHRSHPDLDVPYNEEGIRIGIEAASLTTMDGLTKDLQSATHRLLSERCPRVGTWGFCFGGSLAYLSATFPEVSAAVSFYGGQIAKSASPARPAMIEFTELIQAPLFLAFGAEDHGIPPEEVDAIRLALTEKGKKFELHVYPDAGHAFFRHGVGGESTAAAREVWPQVREFLNKNLAL
jgi:carboxymethylenebutenolidase